MRHALICAALTAALLCLQPARGEDGLRALEVRGGSVQTLAVAGRAEACAVSVVIDGVAVDVLLTPMSLRSSGFVVRSVGADGTKVVSVPGPMTFSGTLPGFPAGAARLSVVRGSWSGVIDKGDGSARVWVQGVEGGAGGVGLHAVYAGDGLLPTRFVCGGGIDPGVMNGMASLAGVPKGAGGGATCVRTTEIAFDADSLYYAQCGGTEAATIADIESVLNAMDLIYTRDAAVNFTLTGTVVRPEALPSLYATSAIGTLLTDLRTEWTTNQAAIPHDLAHLMTGQPTGSTIGLAYVGVVCSGSRYGVSRSRFSTNFARRVGVTAHEVGHNFSAVHCNGDSDCAIMCSSIGGCTGDSTRFGTRSVLAIRNHALGRTCLTASAGVAAEIPPRVVNDTASTVPGAAVTVDVLANDLDGNCQTLTVQSWTASTGRGTVTLAPGAGSAGRDGLRFTANANATAGSDAVLYTVSDGSGLTGTGTLTVTVLPPRVPDFSGPTRPQLEAAYYRLNGPNTVPQFERLTPFATDSVGVSTLGFASTSGAVLTSGRSDSVGVRLRGTLNVPSGGSWTFYTNSDDGSVLLIDGVRVVENDYAHGAQERSGTVVLTAGPHQIEVGYFEVNSAAQLTTSWQGPGVAKQSIPAASLSGVVAEYYETPSLSGLPDFATIAPFVRGAWPDLNIASSGGNFAGSGRRDDIGAVFSGYLSVPATGVYTLFTESDDGSRLLIGDTLVVDNNFTQGMTERSGVIALQAGLHSLRVEYFDGGSSGGLIARWQSGPSVGTPVSKGVIPASALVRRVPACNGADVGGQGGVVGSDGLLNNNDFVAFIDLYFQSDARADVGRQGGIGPGDGAFDNNDFVVFVDVFFSPCQ